MNIPNKLKDEIWDYCRLNNISNVDEFIQKMVKQGFNIEKYGNSPFDVTKEPELIEKEVIREIEKIVEKRVEVPVEVIKEVEVEKIVEKRIEVPVEKVVVKEVIREVPVDKVIEKEVYITDDKEIKKLTEKINQLSNNLDEERQKFSNISNNLDEERQKFSTKTDEITNIFQKELDEVRRQLDEKSKVVVDDKYKKFWEDEIIAHDKTKERIKELEDIIKHLQGTPNDDSDIYGSDNKGWWSGGSNIFRKK